MSKELKTLVPSVVLKFVDGLLKRYEGKTDYNIYITKDWLLEIKQCLKRLEAIDNAEPSEALNGLEFICKILNEKRIDVKWLFKKDYNTIKQALLQAQKDRKALEIIKEKNVACDLFWNDFVDNGFGYHYYLEKWYKFQSTDNKKLTEEEFNLLKEVLE